MSPGRLSRSAATVPPASRRSGATSRLAVGALAGALVVSLVGDQFTALASAFILARSALAASGVAVLLAAEAFPRMLFARRLGALVDRIGARRALLCVLPVEALVSTTLAAAHRQVIVLLALVVLLAILGAVASTATFVTVRQLAVGERGLLRLNALLEVVVGSALFAGPVAGGLVAQHFGYRVTYLGDAASFAIAAVVVAAFVPRGATTPGPAPSDVTGSGTAGGARFRLWRHPRVRAVLPAALSAIVASSATNVAFVFWVRERAGADSATAYGLLIAAWSAGSLLGAVATGRIASSTGLSPGALALAGAVGIGLAEALAGFRVPLVAVGTGWVAGGFANALHNVCLRQLVHLSVPADQQGAAFGEYASLSAIALLFGYAIGSVFGARAPSDLYLAGGLAGALVAVTGSARLRRDA